MQLKVGDDCFNTLRLFGGSGPPMSCSVKGESEKSRNVTELQKGDGVFGRPIAF